MKKLGFLVLMLVFTQGSTSAETSTLIPLWGTYVNSLKATLGATADHCVQVGDLQFSNTGTRTLEITVCDQVTGQALAALVDPAIAKAMTIELRFKTKNGEEIKASPLPTDAVTLAQLIHDGLKGNSFFVAAKVGRAGVTGKKVIVFIQFRPMVVQYFVDDISVPGGKRTVVAADAFRAVLISLANEIPIIPYSLDVTR